LKAIVIGLGTQGLKRKNSLIKKNFFVCSLDTKNRYADEKKVDDLKKYNYDTVFLCVPDQLKKKYIFYFLKKKKNVFVEKPLNLSKEDLLKIEKVSNKYNIIFYVGYNHRFEPHLVKTKEYIKKKFLGKIYYLKIYYGNGTSKLVNKSWRRKILKINNDLGSHLIDQLIFLFGFKKYKIIKSIKNNFENKIPDQSNIFLKYNNILINFEMTYCSWENTLIFFLIGSKASIKIDNLCKWGPSIFKFQKRVLPSGKPKTISKKLIISDPTWDLELKYFNNLIKKKVKNNLKRDLFIKKFLNKL
jgi:predicted dehydrogenase